MCLIPCKSIIEQRMYEARSNLAARQASADCKSYTATLFDHMVGLYRVDRSPRWLHRVPYYRHYQEVGTHWALASSWGATWDRDDASALRCSTGLNSVDKVRIDVPTGLVERGIKLYW